MSHEDIRERLAAVEGIDWGTVERQTNEEHVGDWVLVGDQLLIAAYGPGDAAAIDFIRNAAADIQHLLAEREADQQATTRRESVVSNPIYGKPPEGEPIKLLSDAVEVMRPNGSKVTMDLVALADIAIGGERALAQLREDLGRLANRVTVLEEKSGRQERAGRILAGGGEYEEPDEDLEERVRALERDAGRQSPRRRANEMEMRERET